MTQFYREVLELKIVSQNQDSTSFQIGSSILKFTHKPNSKPYHFAINIPAYKELEALEWVKLRTEILTDNSLEIQDFYNWNAKAIYFYDTDKNIVEFIARRNLKNESEQPFDSNQLLEISEIGIPITNIEYVYNKLHDNTGINIFDGNLERFCAMGDDHGLFICINKNVKDWFPTNDKAYSSDFRLNFSENGKPFDLQFKDEEIIFVKA